MDRTEYVYDAMSRNILKKEIFHENTVNAVTGLWNTPTLVERVVKAYEYDDQYGNVIKELDALGYEDGIAKAITAQNPTPTVEQIISHATAQPIPII